MAVNIHLWNWGLVDLKEVPVKIILRFVFKFEKALHKKANKMSLKFLTMDHAEDWALC